MTTTYQRRQERVANIKADLAAMTAGDPTVRDQLSHMAQDQVEELLDAAAWWFNGEYASAVPAIRRELVARALDTENTQALSVLIRTAMYEAAADLFENTSLRNVGSGQIVEADNGRNHGCEMLLGSAEIHELDEPNFDPEDAEDVDHGPDVLTWADIQRMEDDHNLVDAA